MEYLGHTHTTASYQIALVSTVDHPRTFFKSSAAGLLANAYVPSVHVVLE